MASYARNTAIFSVLTLCSRLTGLLRIIVFTFAIGGRDILADAFQLANLVPNIIYEYIAGGMMSAIFIPLLVRAQEKDGKTGEEAWRVANLLLGAVSVILLTVTLVAMLCSPVLINTLTMMSSGTDAAAARPLATTLFYFFAPQILCLGLNAVFMAILNANSVFAVTAAAPIINNIVCIITLLAYRYGLVGVTGLAVGTTLGVFSMVLVQLPWLLKLGMKVRPKFNLKDPIFKSVTKLGIPVLGESVANLFGWIFRSNLLFTVVGAFAIYTICFQIVMMPYGIFACSIATVLFPALARHMDAGRIKEFVADMSLGIRWTTFIMLPVGLGVCVLALPLTRALFEHRGGRFEYADSLFMAKYLNLYALSIVPYALVVFGTRIFYSMKDTKTPAVINISGVFTNAALSYFLLKKMGTPGIGLAASITYTLTMLTSYTIIRRRIGSLDGKKIIFSIAKMAGASILMVIAVTSLERYTQPQFVVIENGTRLKMNLPQSALSGNIVSIPNEESWRKIWEGMGKKINLLPEIDFEKNSLALVIAPIAETTTTMRIRDFDPKSNLVRMTIAKSNGTSNTLENAEGDYRPAYTLLKTKFPTQNTKVDFTIVEAGKSHSAGFFHGEIFRLIVLIATGGIVYFVSALLLQTEELSFFWNSIKKKIRRS